MDNLCQRLYVIQPLKLPIHLHLGMEELLYFVDFFFHPSHPLSRFPLWFLLHDYPLALAGSSFGFGFDPFPPEGLSQRYVVWEFYLTYLFYGVHSEKSGASVADL